MRKADGQKLTAYRCPHCAKSIETMAYYGPAKGEWDSFTACPYCEKLHVRVTTKRGARGYAP